MFLVLYISDYYGITTVSFHESELDYAQEVYDWTMKYVIGAVIGIEVSEKEQGTFLSYLKRNSDKERQVCEGH